jgi:hypothetical protein
MIHVYSRTLKPLRMWMSMANLPSNQAEVQTRISDLEARLKTRGQRPEPDIPDLGSLPGPVASQVVRTQRYLQLFAAARCCDVLLFRFDAGAAVQWWCREHSGYASTSAAVALQLSEPCAGDVMEAAEELTLDRAPATKLTLEKHDSSVEQKRNCTDYAVIGSTLLLRACPLPAQQPRLLPAGPKISLPPIKKVIPFPELRLHLNYSQFSSTEMPHPAPAAACLELQSTKQRSQKQQSFAPK